MSTSTGAQLACRSSAGYREHRYQSRPGDAPPPDLLSRQQAPLRTQPLSSGVRSAFVRGGELHTVQAAEEEQLQQGPPSVPGNEVYPKPWAACKWP